MVMNSVDDAGIAADYPTIDRPDVVASGGSSRRLRIAVLSRNFDSAGGGAERYALAVAQLLAQQHEIHVFTQHADSVVPGVTVHRVPLPLRRPRWINQLYFATVTWWRTRRGFDIVHSHENSWHGQAQTAHVLPVKHNVFHGKTGLAYAAAVVKVITSPRLLTYLALERLRFRARPDSRVIATSTPLGDALVRAYPALQGRMEIIAPGIDRAPGRCDAATQRAARRSLGLPEDGFGLLLVGNDFKKKGLPTLLRTLVDSPQIDWLAVVGHSRQLPQMQAMAAALGLVGQVYFLGACKDMEPVYRAADLLVHPTLEDSYAMVVLEAMAFGVPVVVSGKPYCGIAAHLQHGVDAWVLDDPHSEVALAFALKTLLQDAALRHLLAANGHAFAQSAHWTGVAQAHSALFARMVSQHPPRWLVLSHAFNMDGRAASQTITDKMPHLAAAGIELVVLSGVLGRRDTTYEHHGVWPLAPAGIRFELRHVLRQHLHWPWQYRFVMLVLSAPLLPFMLIEKLFWRIESSWSWWITAYALGRWLIYRRKFDLIYSTGGAYAAHIAGAALQRATGVPWMAEVHDPMVVPGVVPSTPQQRKQAQVEALICAQADVAIWFTEQALATARKRHPELGGRGRAMVPGVDPPTVQLQPYRRGDHFVIAHFGSLARTRNLVRVIAAVELVLRAEPSLRGVLQVHTYGGPLDALSAQAIAASEFTDAFVHFGRLETDEQSAVPGRQQVLQRMHNSDVLLLLHGTDLICAEYIPSKLYEYLWMQRPILALVHENPQMAEMLVAQHHTVIRTDRHTETGDQTNVALSEAIIALADAWRRQEDRMNIFTSPYSTRAAVRQMLEWQRPPTGALQ